MKSHRQKGFTLFIVIVFLSLVGVILVVLSNNMKNLAYETTAERLKVFNDVLASSSLAWAKQNRLELVKNGVGETIELDVSDYGINGGSSAIEVMEIEKGEMKIEVKTACSRGRIKLKRTLQASLKID